MSVVETTYLEMLKVQRATTKHQNKKKISTETRTLPKIRRRFRAFTKVATKKKLRIKTHVALALKVSEK